MAATSTSTPISTPTATHGWPTDWVTDRAAVWGEQAGRSARSVLVTVFGDCLAPLGQGVGFWLADLAKLAATFGFNERLVRTSLSRLAADDWVRAERVGRRSRYFLSDYGRHETDLAESRIYGQTPQTPTDDWLLVFLGPDGPSELATHLRWRGFAEVSSGVWAHPQPVSIGPAERRLVDPFPPTATASFDDPAGLAHSDTFRASTGLDRTELAYLAFLDRYEPLGRDIAEFGPGDDPRAAFALRTMLVHDYRRIRLAEPDLPPDVLGTDWVGDTAYRLARTLYHTLSPLTWDFVGAVTGHAPQPADRFPDTRSPA